MNLLKKLLKKPEPFEWPDGKVPQFSGEFLGGVLLTGYCGGKYYKLHYIFPKCYKGMSDPFPMALESSF